MNDTETLTLTGFLLARIAEETEREIADDRLLWMDGISDDRAERAAATFEKLTATQGRRLDGSLRGLWWVLVALAPVAPLRRAARARAATYADHPDYREEWRP